MHSKLAFSRMPWTAKIALIRMMSPCPSGTCDKARIKPDLNVVHFFAQGEGA